MPWNFKKKLLSRYKIFVFHFVFSLSQMHCVFSLTAIEWVMMSSAELFIAQLFFLAGFFISKRLDGISTIHSVRRSQKRKLWSVVIVFEVRTVWGGKLLWKTWSKGWEILLQNNICLHILEPVLLSLLEIQLCDVEWFLWCPWVVRGMGIGFEYWCGSRAQVKSWRQQFVIFPFYYIEAVVSSMATWW